MNIAILETPGTFRIADQPVPEIESHQVLLRVAACGVCTSELDLWEGRAGTDSLPKSIGHEVSGVVEVVGADVIGLNVGDQVAAWVTTKGFAAYVAVDAAYCFSAQGVPLDLALGEPLACAVNAVERADPQLADDVVIIGAGFMGNLVQKLVHLRGPNQVIVADTRPDALERAAKIGATRTVDVRSESLTEVVQSLTAGRGADVTFEVTGAQGGLDAAGEVTRMEGTLAIVGYHQGGMREIPLAQWNWMAFRIANCHFRDVGTILHGMNTGMRLLRSRRIVLDDLVSHRFSLDDIGQAFQMAHDKPPGFVKATVVFDEIPHAW
ncbi:MAG: zinc-binding dehydrogenase [Chloroflexota bacterium]|nr:zinc-binding dehydrogenase [Chloroflexota bacterium]